MPELPPHLAAVLFDLDGTLIDGYPAIAASVNHVRGLHGLSPLTVAEVTRHVGRGPEHLFRHTVERGTVEANLAAYRAHHPTVLRSGTTLLPGAREALAALHGRGLKLGICSNKPVAYTRDLVDVLGLAGLFDVVLGPEDTGRHKPAPDVLLLAMCRLEVTADQTLYVGDMVVDVETARAAGVRVWVVATGSDPAEVLDRAGPDRRLGSLTELA